MLLKSCNRCGNLIPYGPTYCSTCEPIVKQERDARRAEAIKQGNKRYNKKRDPKYMRFYSSSDWRILSAKYTQDKGYRCECCGRIGSEVHHKIPIQTPDGWEHRLDYNGLELLCTDCHNARHERFKRRMNYIKRTTPTDV